MNIPKRFKVLVRTVGQKLQDYTICTRHQEPNAIAFAYYAHSIRYPADPIGTVLDVRLLSPTPFEFQNLPGDLALAAR